MQPDPVVLLVVVGFVAIAAADRVVVLITRKKVRAMRKQLQQCQQEIDELRAEIERHEHHNTPKRA